MKYLGAASGFVFGLLGFLIASLGLVSIGMELLFPLYFPIGLILRGMNFPGMLIIAIILNALLFAVFGHALQLLLRRSTKSEKLVLYVFIGLVLLAPIVLTVEYLTRGLTP